MITLVNKGSMLLIDFSVNSPEMASPPPLQFIILWCCWEFGGLNRASTEGGTVVSWYTL